MRAASARRSSGSSVRGIADKNSKWWDVRDAKARPELLSSCARPDNRERLSLRGNRCPLPQFHYLVQHAVCNFPFRGFGNLDHFVVRDDRDRVTVGIKTNALARNVIHYD